MHTPRFWVLVLMICIPAGLRLADLPWNFAPIGALALFAGAHFREKTWAFAVPLGAMLASDVAIGLLKHDMAFYTFHTLMPVVYVCYALYVCLGFLVPEGKISRSGESSASGRFLRQYASRVVPIAGTALAGSLLFFVITNFAHWALTANYPKTWAGLLLCYESAIPFFRSTVAGDAFYAIVLFGGYAFLKEQVPALRESGLLHAERS